MEIINSFSWLEDIVIALGGVLCIYFGYRLFVLGASQTFKLFSHLKVFPTISLPNNLLPRITAVAEIKPCMGTV